MLSWNENHPRKCVWWGERLFQSKQGAAIHHPEYNAAWHNRKTIKWPRWQQDNSIQFKVNIVTQALRQQKSLFHIGTVNLYMFPLTSELLLVESSSFLLVFPVRWEQRKQTILFLTLLWKWPSALQYLLNFQDYGKEIGVKSTVGCRYSLNVSCAKKIHSFLTNRSTETSSGRAVLMDSDGATYCTSDWGQKRI